MTWKLKAATAAIAVLAFAGGAAAEGELNIYNWGDYTSPEMIKKFEEANNIKVTITDYDSNDTALAKVRAGGHGFDIVVPSANYVPIWVKEGLLLEARPDQMENFKNVDERWVDVAWDPGRHYTVPWQWGLTGIGINLLNPKVVLFFITFLPQFVDRADPAAPQQLFFLGAEFIAVSIPLTVLTVLLAEQLTRLLTHPFKQFRDRPARRITSGGTMALAPFPRRVFSCPTILFRLIRLAPSTCSGTQPCRQGSGLASRPSAVSRPRRPPARRTRARRPGSVSIRRCSR